MSDPIYTLTQFQYDCSGATPLLSCSIIQTIEGKDWVYHKPLIGDAATNLWNQRGKTEQELIALILAA